MVIDYVPINLDGRRGSLVGDVGLVLDEGTELLFVLSDLFAGTGIGTAWRDSIYGGDEAGEYGCESEKAH